MSYKVDWLLEDRVVLGKIWGQNTLNDLINYNSACLNMLDQANFEKVHFIVDARYFTTQNISLKQQKEHLNFHNHPKFVGVVIIKSNMNHVANFVITALLQLISINVHVTDSPIDALAYLQRDPLLPNLQPYLYFLNSFSE